MIWLIAVVFLFCFVLCSQNRIWTKLIINEEKIELNVLVRGLDSWFNKHLFLVYCWKEAKASTNIRLKKAVLGSSIKEFIKAVLADVVCSSYINSSVNVRIGLGSAAAAAISSTILFELLKTAGCLSLRYVPRQRQHICVEPLFREANSNFYVYCMVSVRTVHIIFALLKHAQILLRRKKDEPYD